MRVEFDAYMAGVADSDGSFSFSKLRRACNINGYQFRPCFSLTWTATEITRLAMDKIKLEYGGSVCTCIRKGGYPTNHPAVYKYYVQGIRCAELCDRLYPYLLLKGEKARLISQYYKLVNGKRGIWNRNRAKPKEVYEEEARLWLLFNQLNTKNKKVLHEST